MFALRTFGGTALFDDDRPLEGPAVQRRRLALLALLAVAGDSGMSRDKLLALLWPETDTERARHTLSQWLHLLRRDLRTVDVVQGTADLRLNEARVASDVRAFERAIARGDVRTACDLYTGPFLDGFHLSDSPEFERWLDVQRARLAEAWRRAAETLAAECARAGDHAAAAAIWRRLAAAEPFESRCALALMRALAAAGDVPAALTHARIHAQLLEQEFGEPMPAEVRALAEELAAKADDARRRSRSVPTPALAGPAEPVPSTMPDSEQVTPTVASIRQQPPRRHRALRVGVSLAAVVLLAIVALVVLVPRQVRATVLTVLSREPGPLNPRLVVVAPLTNATGDSSLNAFGDMAADWMAQALMRTGELEVADPSSAILTSRVVDMLPRLLRPSNRALALAAELGAGQAIEGRFYEDGDSLWVQAHLVDVATGRVRQIIGPVPGVRRRLATVVQDLADRVAATAAARTDGSYAGAGVALSAPPSFEAYRETRRAWESYYRGDLEALTSHAARARATDSAYMLPLIILGHVYSEQRDWRGVDSVAKIVSAHRSRLTSLELAGSDLLDALAGGNADAVFVAGLEVAHAAPASVETRTHAAHLAVEANRPRDALAILAGMDPTRGLLLVVPWYWSWKCAALHEMGDFAGQREVAEQGLRQFPDNPALLLHLGRALGALGREEELLGLMDKSPARPASRAPHLAVLQRDAMALEWSRELAAHGHRREAAHLAALVASHLDRPDADTSTRTMKFRAMALELSGQWIAARTAFARLAAHDPDDVSSRGHLAVAEIRTGQLAEAERIDRELAAMTDDRLHGLAAVWRARIAAARGDLRTSAALAAVAVENGYMRGYDLYGSSFGEFDLHTDPLLAPVRALPEMRRLLAPRG